MPGRPPRRDDEARDDVRRAGGVVPAGALAMLLAISGVFVYGIYLKAAGPSESLPDAPAPKAPAPAKPASPGGARPSATPTSPSPGESIPTETAMGYGDEPLAPDAGESTPILPPVLPEATTAGTIGGGGLGVPAAAPAPRASAPPPTSTPVPRTTDPSAASSSAPRASSAPLPSSPVPPRASAPPAHSEPRTTPGNTAPAVPSPAPKPADSRIASSPRGAAPAVALKKAREQFQARKYTEAARSWNDWARRAPSGSWTVQIAAIRLDKASSTAKLQGIAGRDGAFVLPSGALPGGLAPVCVGVYPSEEAARRAAATMAPFPGSSNRPIPKPLSSLSN